MHFSGCPASCAQPQIADIGFRGDTAHVGDEIVEAVDVGLGGSLGIDAAFADWVLGAVPVDEVPDALGARARGLRRRAAQTASGSTRGCAGTTRDELRAGRGRRPRRRRGALAERPVRERPSSRAPPFRLRPR